MNVELANQGYTDHIVPVSLWVGQEYKPGAYEVRPRPFLSPFEQTQVAALNRLYPDFRKRTYLPIVVVSAPYGQGHINQAYDLSKFLADIFQTPVYSLDALELATGQGKTNLHMLKAWIENVQVGIGNPADLVSRNNLPEFVQSHITKSLLNIAAAQVKHPPEGQPLSLSHQVIQFLNGVSKEIPGAEAIILRDVVNPLINMVMQPYQKDLLPILDQINPGFIIFTHSGLGAAVVGTKYENLSAQTFPDPGMALPDAMAGLLTKSNKMAITVADEASKQVLYSTFQVPEKNIYVTGTIGPFPEGDEVMKKWHDLSQIQVLCSTSGSGANLTEITRGLIDFVPYSIKHPHHPFYFKGFLGHHSDAKVAFVVQTFNDVISALKTNHLEHLIPQVRLLRTTNSFETAQLKAEALRDAHFEGAKGGEPPLSDQDVGTITILFKDTAPNELINTIYATEVTESHILSPWPPQQHQYWTTHPQIDRRKHPELEKPYDNLFDLLAYQLGENPERRNYAKERAFRSYHLAGNTALTDIAGIVLDRTTKPDKKNLPGDVKKRYDGWAAELKIAPKVEMVYRLMTTHWEDAFVHRHDLFKTAYRLLGYQSPEHFIADLPSQRVKSVIVAAGAQTRWNKSLEELNNSNGHSSINPTHPRGLAEVVNLIPGTFTGPTIPNGAYALDASRHLPDKILVCNPGDEQLMHEQLVRPMRMDHKVVYANQDHRGVGPLGHGDLLIQLRPQLQNSQIVLVQNLGDTYTSQTLLTALAAFLVARKYDFGLDALLPSSFMSDQHKYRYPFYINESGVPQEAGHAKLNGNASLQEGSFPSDVGIRIYAVEPLLSILDEIWARYQQYNSYTFLNHGQKNEFAYNHIEQKLMEEQRLVQLCIAPPNLFHGIKEISDLEPFNRVMEQLIQIQ